MRPIDPDSEDRSLQGVAEEAQLPALAWMRRAQAQEEILSGLPGAVGRRLKRKAIALSGVCAAILVVTLVWLVPAGRRPAVQTPTSRTATVSMPERQILPDGSVVDLKEGAHIAVDYSGALRRVTLQNGEALFQVAKNKERAFVVQAGGMEVRAVGTAFAVQLGQDKVEVLVTEGRVTVDKSVPSGAHDERSTHPDMLLPQTIATVDAGHRVVIDTTTVSTVPAETVTSTEISDQLAWRIPQIEFSRTPLPEAVALVNRHNKVQFVVADPGLQDVKLSGFVRADNTDGLVLLLENNFGVKAERSGDTITLRKAQ